MVHQKKALAKASAFFNEIHRSVDEIVFDDEIPCGNEIRLDGGWVDFISSKP